MKRAASVTTQAQCPGLCRSALASPTSGDITGRKLNPMSKIHQVLPDERIRYADPLTGREVIQLTSKANNAKAYFTAPHFVDGGRMLVFCSDRSGTWEVFK